MSDTPRDISPEQQALFARLLDFEFDDPDAELPFTERLAREQGWSRGDAIDAADEYRKFMFLLVEAGHPCTPSEAIDQVWHLHLAYTRTYWDEWCGEVIGRPIHHEPTKGGADEQARFVEQYEATLASYERFFGPPPVRWWPSPAERFRHAGALRWVNLRRTIVIGRSLKVGLQLLIVAALAAIGLVLVSGTWGGPGPWNSMAGVFALFAAWVGVIAIIGKPTRGHSGGGCGNSSNGDGGCGGGGCGGGGD